MYTGLEQQVFMDTTTQSQLPTLPVELLKSSSLAGGMVEWLLGDGLLLSPDPSALIRLHPLAIAGFVGLVSNALNLLPIGSKSLLIFFHDFAIKLLQKCLLTSSF